ncbi:MAG TPA: exosortase/archaeosortase family protein [Gemmatimonadaceae bacterium]|nr:exosortase/archaeosortase family protein [Gemmatimonadaceae bacterium]
MSESFSLPAGSPSVASPPRAAAAGPPAASRTRLMDDIRAHPLPVVVTAALFLIEFAKPMQLLGRDWWSNPEAGHGLLLAPLALWLAWSRGVRADARSAPALGLTLLVGAVLLRYMSGLAAELYTMRLSMLMALGGLTVYAYGVRQLLHWWLPFTVLWLSVPLPELVTSGIAMPLQMRASRMGAALLEWRQVPVLLDGNVIRLPGGNNLFVAEACSGLRSLTALLSLGVLLGGMVLRWPVSRMLLVLLAIPIAVLINGVRVFLTGFLVFFVGPEAGQGFMHVTEGWLMFLVDLLLLGLCAWLVLHLERAIAARRVAHA